MRNAMDYINNLPANAPVLDSVHVIVSKIIDGSISEVDQFDGTIEDWATSRIMGGCDVDIKSTTNLGTGRLAICNVTHTENYKCDPYWCTVQEHLS